MASKLIELADGTPVEIEVSETKAQPIAGGAAEKLQDATIDKVKPILLKACKPIIEVWKELNKDMHIEQAAVELGLGFEAEGNLYPPTAARRVATSGTPPTATASWVFVSRGVFNLALW